MMALQRHKAASTAGRHANAGGSEGSQFVLHANALRGSPYDGHTLGRVVAEMQKLTGVEVHRIHVQNGYRGHTHPNTFRVWISGQVR